MSGKVIFRKIGGRIVPIFKKGNVATIAAPKIQKLATQVDELKFYKQDWSALSGATRNMIRPSKKDMLDTFKELNKKRYQLAALIRKGIKK